MRGEPMWQRGALYIFFLFLPCFHVGGAGILFLGWIAFSLRMPASGVPNYLTAHHHYKTAHPKRPLAHWALGRNQGGPHGEGKKKKTQICKSSHQIACLCFSQILLKKGHCLPSAHSTHPTCHCTNKKLRTTTSKEIQTSCWKKSNTNCLK